jgi:hypothetical protein
MNGQTSPNMDILEKRKRGRSGHKELGRQCEKFGADLMEQKMKAETGYWTGL